ncbi:hypothetical protein H9P43_007196 [Blastocladiella emersonii ATCC 22665]|nr:hypothetical protein H9P43_007196 [Blastocladiella emersonii ATCC 22665]
MVNGDKTRIDVSTDEVDVILDNVTLAATILPKDVAIKTETHLAMDVAAAGSGTAASSTVQVELRNVQLHAPNLVFYYYKKTFPSFADVGIADVSIARRGLDVDLVVRPSADAARLLDVVRTEARVNDLDLDVKKARHNWLYAVLSPVVRRIVAARIEAAIAESLGAAVERLDKAVESAVAASGKAASALSASAVAQSLLKSEE